VQLRASAKGWAAMYLRAHPYTRQMRRTRQEHEAKAMEQGLIAINSILRGRRRAGPVGRVGASGANHRAAIGLGRAATRLVPRQHKHSPKAYEGDDHQQRCELERGHGLRASRFSVSTQSRK
jgi:hypothetical protein